MSAALSIDRDESQVQYLTTTDCFGLQRHVEMGQVGSVARFGVLRFADGGTDRIILRADAGPFQLFCGLAVAEARLLALALNTAADESEAAS